MAGQAKKMAAERLSFEQRKIILKWYWNFENVCEVRRQWRREFATEPPIRLTIACIRDKFETDGTVHGVHKEKSGRLCTAMRLASSSMLLGQFTRLPQRSSSHFTCNKMARHHTTTEISEGASMKSYQVNGQDEEVVLSMSSYSPDSTSFDFYLWGSLKDAIYRRKPSTLDKSRVQLFLGHACSCTRRPNSEVSTS
jgi:hypothetical protein